MASRSRESVKGESSEPELESNIRTLVGTSASVWQTESKDAQMSTESFGAMLGEVSRVSIGEVDHLITELQTLLRKLQSDGDRIERDIRQHAVLSEQATQLTKIVFEGMKQLPSRA